MERLREDPDRRSRELLQRPLGGEAMRICPGFRPRFAGGIPLAKETEMKAKIKAPAKPRRAGQVTRYIFEGRFGGPPGTMRSFAVYAKTLLDAKVLFEQEMGAVALKGAWIRKATKKDRSRVVADFRRAPGS
jgi:hypothetical protein